MGIKRGRGVFVFNFLRKRKLSTVSDAVERTNKTKTEKCLLDVNVAIKELLALRCFGKSSLIVAEARLQRNEE